MVYIRSIKGVIGFAVKNPFLEDQVELPSHKTGEKIKGIKKAFSPVLALNRIPVFA